MLAYPDWSDAATLTASNETAASPGTYLQRMQPSEVWRSTDLTSIYFELDRGVDWQRWNLVSLLWSNASEEALWRIRTANSQANLTAAPIFDTGQALRVDDTSEYAEQSGLSNAVPFTFQIEGRPLNEAVGATLARLTWATSGAVLSIFRSGTTLSVQSTPAGILLASDILDPFQRAHVTVKVTSTTASLYVDGALVDTDTHALSMTGTVTVRVGNLTAAPWEGDISRVRYYGRELDTAQIAGDWMRLTPTDTTSLIGHWVLNGNTTNTGSAGGSMTVTGSPVYVMRERLWASRDLDAFTRRHGLLWRPFHEPSWTYALNERWLRIDLDDPNNAAGYLTGGRLVVANAYQATTNYQAGGGIPGFIDDTQQEALPGGQVALHRFEPRGFLGPVTLLTDDEDEVYNSWYPIMRLRAAGRDVLAVTDPDPGKHTFKKMAHGLLSNRQAPTRPDWARYTWSFEVTGLG